MSNIQEQPGSGQPKEATVSFLDLISGTDWNSPLSQSETVALWCGVTRSASVTAHRTPASCLTMGQESREVPSSDNEQSSTRASSESLTDKPGLGSSCWPELDTASVLIFPMDFVPLS